MKRFVLFTLMLATMMPMVAEERSDSEMKAIAAQHFFGTMTKGLKGSSVTNSLAQLYANDAAVIFAPENAEGFVVVSRDDSMRPVLGYSSARFQSDNIPCGMKWWLDAVAASAQAQRKAPGKNLGGPLKTFTPIEPMLKTYWAQDDPYNRLTPIEGEDHALTGCVATCLAQMLYFNRYPESATYQGLFFDGPAMLNEDETGYLNLMGIDINSTYNWDDFQNAYGYYSTNSENLNEDAKFTDEAAENVANLMFDCGAAVFMQYTEDGSGAVLSDSYYALTECFSYPKEAVKYYERLYYTNDEWLEIIRGELSKGTPVIYGGESADRSGHAFILHGMNEEGLFYVNWGWRGYCDGYFSLDELHTPNGKFDYMQDMIVGARPKALDTDLFKSYFIAHQPYEFRYDNKYTNPLILTLSFCYNYSIETFEGVMDIVIKDNADNTYSYVNFIENFNMGSYYGWRKYEYGVEYTFKPGHTYTIYAATKDVREKDYTPIRVDDYGYLYYTVTVDAKGIPSFSEEQYAPSLATAIKSIPQERQIADGMTRVYDMQGRLVHTAPTASFNLWDVKARGVLIIKQGDSTRRVVR